jgi:hypothetical protein
MCSNSLKYRVNEYGLRAETFNVIECFQMQQARTPPINAIDIRAHEYSPDGKNIVISLATKYAAERRTYSVPVESLYELLSDLKTIKRPSDNETSDGSALHQAPQPSSEASDQKTTSATPKDLTRLSVTVPKKWMLRSALPEHPLVVLVFDPMTEKQSGYGLTVAAAREMAVGLVKYADTIVKNQNKTQKPN